MSFVEQRHVSLEHALAVLARVRDEAQRHSLAPAASRPRRPENDDGRVEACFGLAVVEGMIDSSAI